MQRINEGITKKERKFKEKPKRTKSQSPTN